jgi:hypothetical protein
MNRDRLLRTERIYEFDCAGITYHIVRLPCETAEHDPKLIDYCTTVWGDADHIRGWSKGAICTRTYQEYWFRDRSHATQFILAWG